MIKKKRLEFSGSLPAVMAGLVMAAAFFPEAVLAGVDQPWKESSSSGSSVELPEAVSGFMLIGAAWGAYQGLKRWDGFIALWMSVMFGSGGGFLVGAVIAGLQAAVRFIVQI